MRRWMTVPLVVLAPVLLGGTAAGAVLAMDLASDAGIDHVHHGFHRGSSPDDMAFYEATGGGACWGDADGDGRLDLYVTNQLDHEGRGSARLYRNVGPDADGTWRFADVAGDHRVGVAGVGQGCLWGDYDNDGWQDLYVTFAVTPWSPQQNVLFRNLGEGRGFTDVTAEAGVTGDATDPRASTPCHPSIRLDDGRVVGRCWSIGAAWIDHDLDGDLDLYVAGYAQYPLGACVHEINGNPNYCQGQANRLYRNEGDGTFTDVAAEAGVAVNSQRTMGRSMGVVTTDADGDGWPDLYVANDMDGNALYVNQRDGTFRDMAPQWGLDNHARNPDGTTGFRAGMGVEAQDLDGDGVVDFLTTHLEGQHDGVYVGGDGWWGDVGAAQGVTRSADGPSRWGGGFVDVDLDGDKDLLLVAGGEYPADPGPVYLYLQHDGRFEEVRGAAWPFADGHLANHRAAAFADHDNDGDIDVLVNALHGGPDAPGRPKLLTFRAADDGGRSLRVVLQGTDAARDAVGAKVTVTTGDGRTQNLWRTSGASYAGSHDPRLLFGLGNATSGTITVTWPGGATQGPVPFDLEGGRFAEVMVLQENRLPPAPATPEPLQEEGNDLVVSWAPSFAADFAAYQVHQGGRLVEEVADRHATVARLSAADGRDVTVTVVDAAGHASAAVRPEGSSASPPTGERLPGAGVIAAAAVLAVTAWRTRPARGRR